MKSVRFLLVMIVTGTLFSSCSLSIEDDTQNNRYIKEIVSEYDLWYIDYHRTLGNGDIPFISRAFTM